LLNRKKQEIEYYFHQRSSIASYAGTGIAIAETSVRLSHSG